MGVIIDRNGKAVAHFEGEGIGFFPVTVPSGFVKIKSSDKPLKVKKPVVKSKA